MKSMNAASRRTETYGRILDAASAIFSEQGFAGARMDKIAARAGVNKATIYYHIGDKRALYAEVLHHVFSNTSDRMADSIQQHGSVEEKLATFIRSFADMLDRHPHLSSIMMREIASGGLNFPDIAVRDMVQIFGLLRDILKDGAARGVFIHTAPFIVHMMIVGTSIFYRASGPIRVRNPELPDMVKHMDPNMSGRIADEIARLVLKAVKK